MSDEISLIPSIGISASGLDAQAKRMEIIANNVANAGSTRGHNGRLYRRKTVIFASKLRKATGRQGNRKQVAGVEIIGVAEDQSEPMRVYRPGHPDADKDGYVRIPNVNPVEEMANMMSATRAYEANLAAIKAARTMANQALKIGK